MGLAVVYLVNFVQLPSSQTFTIFIQSFKPQIKLLLFIIEEMFDRLAVFKSILVYMCHARTVMVDYTSSMDLLLVKEDQ